MNDLVARPKLTKADLRKIYRAWAREEAEAIDVLEAVAKYLGDAGRSSLAEGRLKEPDHGETN